MFPIGVGADWITALDGGWAWDTQPYIKSLPLLRDPSDPKTKTYWEDWFKNDPNAVSISFAGNALIKWNGSGWDGSDGFALRIAVGPTGNPWVVTNANTIYRHSTNSPFSGSWELLPDHAYDIGIGPGNVAWKVLANGSSTNLSVWEEQPFANGSPPASALRQWRSAGNFATTSTGISVSVGPGARPFFVKGNGSVVTSLQ